MHLSFVQAVRDARGFVGRQKRNYRVGVARSSAQSFLTGLSSQYAAIYGTALGADTVQLGSLSSIGSMVSAAVSLPVGWLVDRHGIKVFHLTASALSVGSALVYAIANDWRFLVVAAVLGSVSLRLSGMACSVICSDSVKNQDRATAQSVCSALGAVASMVAPLLAAYLITRSGGLNLEGLRPLFYFQACGYALVFVMILLYLREPRRSPSGTAHDLKAVVAGFAQVFQGRPEMRRWVAVVMLTSMTMPMF